MRTRQTGLASACVVGTTLVGEDDQRETHDNEHLLDICEVWLQKCTQVNREVQQPFSKYPEEPQHSPSADLLF
jgi:hypothetical protein